MIYVIIYIVLVFISYGISLSIAQSGYDVYFIPSTGKNDASICLFLSMLLPIGVAVIGYFVYKTRGIDTGIGFTLNPNTKIERLKLLKSLSRNV
jgi:hypothetical protein